MPIKLRAGWEMILLNGKLCWIISRCKETLSPIPVYWICDEDGKIGTVDFFDLIPTRETENKMRME